MKRLGWLWLLLASFLLGTAQAEVAIPPLKQHITDISGTLSAGHLQMLESRLATFEANKGTQIAVLILPTTQPETIEQFGIRAVEAWKLGRKGVDDGVLLLIAKEDRKLRIEVGYGLEGVLNDATAKRIVAEIISPAFKQGDFYGGIDAGLTSIIDVIQGEALPPPTNQATHVNGFDGVENFLGIAFVIFVMSNLMFRHTFGRLPSGLIAAGLVGGLNWIMFASLAGAIVVGVVIFLLSLILGPNSRSYSAPQQGWGSGSGGGWSGGGGDSWSGGGGGGFGGGGASGDW